MNATATRSRSKKVPGEFSGPAQVNSIYATAKGLKHGAKGKVVDPALFYALLTNRFAFVVYVLREPSY